jgi:hypothetical protein
MRNQKVFVLKPLVVIAVILLFASCGKKGDNPYHIKGKLVADCSGTPVAGIRLRVHQKTNLFGGGGGDKGFDTTDAAGNFDIICPDLNGLGTYLEYGSGDDYEKTIFNDIPVSGTGDNSRVYDLGTVFEQATFSTALKIDIGTSRPTADTLYYGRSRIDYDIIAPMNAGTYQKAFSGSGMVISNTDDSSRMSIFWGIGRKDFDSALNYRSQHRADEPQYHLVTTSVPPCIQGNTVTLSIP